MSESKETNGQMTVDDDVIEWFRNEAGDDYRERMREVLRAHIEAQRDRPDGLTPGRASTMSR